MARRNQYILQAFSKAPSNVKFRCISHSREIHLILDGIGPFGLANTSVKPLGVIKRIDSLNRFLDGYTLFYSVYRRAQLEVPRSREGTKVS